MTNTSNDERVEIVPKDTKSNPIDALKVSKFWNEELTLSLNIEFPSSSTFLLSLLKKIHAFLFFSKKFRCHCNQFLFLTNNKIFLLFFIICLQIKLNCLSILLYLEFEQMRFSHLKTNQQPSH